MHFTHCPNVFRHRTTNQIKQSHTSGSSEPNHTIASIKVAIFFTLCFILSSLALADNLVIPELDSQPPNSAQGVVRPVRGLTMAEVQEQFGTPLNTQGPIGKPPITRWVYDKFTVVFESNIVIHSFAK